MALVLPDDWVWDLWIADTGSEFHIFYLKAPRSLGDPEFRHANATVGHAVSDDLVEWRVLPDALAPGSAGSWDDRAIWTGSVIEVDGVWHMLYTGTSIGEGGLVQRIGLATSVDLSTWTKDGQNPLIEADARWYEKLGAGDWYEEAWRDPWVFSSGGRYHVLVTARSNRGPSPGRGVIGHAVSDDLRRWEVLPPLSEAVGFGHLEVPQVVEADGQHVLVFSCEERKSPESMAHRPEGTPGDATYVVRADSPLGPFDISRAERALPPALYSGRLVQNREGRWVWLAFANVGEDGRFAGEISDPIPLGAI